MVPSRPRHFHQPLPVLARRLHPDLRRPRQHPRPRRLLHRELRHGRSFSRRPVGNGKRAYGAGQLEMLGVYLQRSWIILLATSCLLMFLYIFALPFLLAIGQTESISRASGRLALWMIPQLFAYALNFPTAKFLQAQSKKTSMALISAVALSLHVWLSWLLMLKLDWGMAGGAAVLDASWWFIVLAQLIYVFSGTCGMAWDGFTVKAFQNISSFVRLSVASAVMMWLEVWYFMALVLFAGYLKDAEVAVAALSICTNILGWTNTIAIGFNAAISVRVSNELGAAHPRTAKFSVLVMVILAFLIGLLVSIILLIFQDQYPSLFSDSLEVKEVVNDLTPLLAFCIVINSIQPALMAYPARENREWLSVLDGKL